MSLNSTAGDAAAESYFSVAEADTYFAARGVTAWGSANTTSKEQAARLGTTYLDNAYRDRWKGIRSTQTQALAWPRSDGERRDGVGLTMALNDCDGFQIAVDAVPDQVKRAAMEAALLALNGTTLEPTLERGGQIKSIDKSVGPLRKAVIYMDGAPALDRYTAIEGLLRGLVQSAGNVKLVRA